MTGPDTDNLDPLSCDAAMRRTQLYKQGRLLPFEIEHMNRHLANCPDCAEQTNSVRGLRESLQSLPSHTAPGTLRIQLQVIASREAAKRKASATARDRLRTWKCTFKLWTDNLMRPLAIPTAGGLTSALVLFSVFASAITIPSVQASSDVPTGLYTEASVKTCLPFGFDGNDLAVELTIDDQGRVVDYTLPNLSNATSRELRRNIGNHLLFTQFTPATSFGQPTAGKVRIWFRSSRIDVKG